jgi:hypothetical protein
VPALNQSGVIRAATREGNHKGLPLRVIFITIQKQPYKKLDIFSKIGFTNVDFIKYR